MAGERHQQVFNGRDEAVALLAKAQETGDILTLITAPQASAWLGAGYTAALAAELHEQFPQALDKVIYDCGNRTGDAVAAVRAGIRYIMIETMPALSALTAYAAEQDTVIYPYP